MRSIAFAAALSALALSDKHPMTVRRRAEEPEPAPVELTRKQKSGLKRERMNAQKTRQKKKWKKRNKR